MVKEKHLRQSSIGRACLCRTPEIICIFWFGGLTVRSTVLDLTVNQAFQLVGFAEIHRKSYHLLANTHFGWKPWMIVFLWYGCWFPEFGLFNLHHLSSCHIPFLFSAGFLTRYPLRNATQLTERSFSLIKKLTLQVRFWKHAFPAPQNLFSSLNYTACLSLP